MNVEHLPARKFDCEAVWLAAVASREVVLAHQSVCALYRFYDSDRVLLYVGISRRLADRWNFHRFKTEWYASTRFVAVSFYSEQLDASRAEVAVIRTQGPLFNTQRYQPHRSKPAHRDVDQCAPPSPWPSA